MGSATNRDKLFIYPDTSRDWAINPGGGTELQYHIYLRNNKIGYGLGFNTQYVPFANKKTPVDYIKPFVNSFLSKPEFQQNLVQNGFYYVLGSEDLLKNLENDKYVLIGKELTVLKNNELFELDYLLFEEMISEIKGVLYKTYKNVLLNMNEENKLSESIIEKIKILKHKKQIILQGPPGTGKTYTAKDIAEQFIFNAISSDKKEQKKNLEATDQFSLVQFHPSYSYEDFVRGITAKSEGGNIVYETENKILASFAEKAMSNLSSVNKDVKELSKEQQIEQLLIQFAENIQNEIDDKGTYQITKAVSIQVVEDDAFRYTGDWKTSQRMKFKDLIFAQLQGVTTRQEFKKLNGISGLASQHSSYFIKVLNKFQEAFKTELEKSPNETLEKPVLKNYILIIDEINRANLPSVLGELIYALEYRNESVESIYGIDGNNSITIPDNLFIIGTMNTADRSVGHIDYAIKRRFSFVDILPNADVINNEKSKELFNKVAELFVKEEEGEDVKSEFLASDFEYKDVQLGHSYFILKEGTEDEQSEELQMRLNYEIVPILNEYVKDGLLLETAKDKIKEIASFEC
ncbi:MAG: AAA family ATPase [Lutibacter sp.]|nr:AAA family ATPase [Lutibacter sp.]MBP9600986.1 AAA family ATPase [Lutibacter sp.]